MVEVELVVECLGGGLLELAGSTPPSPPPVVVIGETFQRARSR